MVSTKKHEVTKQLMEQGKTYAQHILKALNESPSHFHAVNYCKRQLRENGFTEIKETEVWNL